MNFSLSNLLPRSGDATAWRHIDEHTLRVVAAEIVELIDCGRTDAYWAARWVCETFPALERSTDWIKSKR
jgi:hypothetical protein